MFDNRIGIIGVIFVCILFAFYSAADELDEQYIGCYQDNVTVRDLENEINLASMTISLCIEHCKNHRKTYAGAQNGERCFCGDTYGTYGRSQECKVNCPGNDLYYCGGNIQNSIYSVCPISRYGISCNRECHCLKDAPCNVVNGSCPNNCATGWSGSMCNVTSVSASGLSHYGCFIDSRTNGFPALFSDPQMTIQLCMDRCRTHFGYYVGLQYGTYCFCGNSSYSANGSSIACGSDCQTPECSCGGSPADRCGGTWANDVYSTCQDGYYGVLCSHQCHCFQGLNCTIQNGTCPASGCSEGWMETSCNIRNCAVNNGNCSENEVCTSEHTGAGAERVVPRCRCREGYTRNQEYEDCKDIDECILSWPSNQCNPTFGDCLNLEGTYNCTCEPGFQNNGNTVCEVSDTSNESDTALIVGLVVGLGVPIIAIAMIAIAVILYKRKETDQQNKADVYTTLDVKRSVPLEMPQQDMHVYTELRVQASPVNYELQNDHSVASENHESVG